MATERAFRFHDFSRELRTNIHEKVFESCSVTFTYTGRGYIPPSLIFFVCKQIYYEVEDVFYKTQDHYFPSLRVGQVLGWMVFTCPSYRVSLEANVTAVRSYNSSLPGQVEVYSDLALFNKK